jgi:DNA adenine methylase
VLVRKPRYQHHELYNDLNNDLVNWWMHIRDHRDALAQRLSTLPYARSLYYHYYASLFDGSELEPLERAVRFFYVLRGTGTGHLRPSPGGWNYLHANALAYSHLLETGFQEVSQRFQQVRIFNHDIEHVLELFDSPTTLWYIDPPYLDAEAYYSYQQGVRTVLKKPFDHHRLAEILNQLQGMVALSTYPHDALGSWYPADRWQTTSWQQPKHSHIQHSEEEKEPATEILLCNYPIPSVPVSPKTLWDHTLLLEDGPVP